MTTEVLFKFAKKDINLSPEAYELINRLDDPLDFSSSLIVRLKSQEFSKNDLISLDSMVVEQFIKTIGLDLPNDVDTKVPPLKSQKTLIQKKNSLDEGSIANKNNLKETIIDGNVDIASVATNGVDNTVNRFDDAIVDDNVGDIDSTSFDASLDAGSSGNTDVGTYNTGNPGVDTSIASSNCFSISDANNSIAETSLDNNSNNSNIQDIKNIQDISGEIETKRFVASECKRNLKECTVGYDFKILQDTSKKSYTSGEIGNLITYFKNRYAKLSSILARRPELKAYQKINDLEEKATGLNLIVMVKEIRTTKNGHRIIVFEDDTDEISVLFHKDNHELFRQSEKLVKDEVIGLIAEKKGDLAIATQIIQPGVPRISEKSMDFSAVFTSDIHIGSLTFLEDAFVRFTDWLNGDYGTEEQREIGNDVKYMIVGGDIVDGIGVYPNQDKELAIKDITEQYDEAARLLGDIRSDVKIIISPGNHDASRVAEPQPAIPEKYAKYLYDLKNVEFVSNPAIVSLDGLNTLIYHGRGFDDIAITVKGFSHERNDLIMEELLNKRHLAPIYGERTPLASELEDHLVIDDIPDIFHTGHVHINTYKNYKGVHMINSGTFQTQTEFQKVHNILPTCAEVPILNRGVYKQLKFI